MEGLQQCSANYVPLSPISFIEGAAFVCGDKVSIVYGSTTYSWGETHQRCLRLASALSQLGVNPGDVVAAVAPNIPALYELHFGVPMAGAVLSPLNPRLDPPTLASIFEQLEPKIIFMDYQFVEVVLKALDHHLLPQKANPSFLIIIPEYNRYTSSSTIQLSQGSSLDYNELLSTGKTDFQSIRPSDECLPISVNYTSGSTGKPKGVVYSHRAAYLNSLAQIFRSDMRSTPVFLWTVDMFRCNGWCFTWAVAALGGTNVCIRNVTAQVIFDSISLHKVTHICGAPAILNTIAEPENRGQIPHRVVVIVAGALPPRQTIDKIMELGFNFRHGYGMTEALGPVCVKSTLREADNEHGNLQGIHNIMGEGVDVKDPKTMMSVPADEKTVGEVMLRSNTMMSGYLKNLEATQKAFSGGWYRTGDLGVRRPDGCIQMKDRRTDAISCGGETISSLEVEAVIASHPMVLEVAVVARSDDVLGATPCAFVKLKERWSATGDEIIRFCWDKLPHFAVPKSVHFGNLPVNSTGKIQKFVLRKEANAMGSLSRLVDQENVHLSGVRNKRRRITAAGDGDVQFEAESIRSTITMERILKLISEFELPSDLRPRVPGANDSACSPRLSEIVVYEAALLGGLRFPLSRFVREVLARLNLSVGQITPNSWRILIGCAMFWPDATRHVLTPNEFLHCYKISKSESGWWYFSARKAEYKFVTHIPKLHKEWKEKYFFIQGSSWEFEVGETDEEKKIWVPRVWGQPTSKARERPALLLEQENNLREAKKYKEMTICRLVLKPTTETLVAEHEQDNAILEEIERVDPNQTD